MVTKKIVLNLLFMPLPFKGIKKVMRLMKQGLRRSHLFRLIEKFILFWKIKAIKKEPA